MKVYLEESGEKRLVGRADIPEDTGPIYEVVLFGAVSSIVDHFALGTVMHLPAGGGAPVMERIVLLAPGQRPEILPRWQPVVS